MMILCLCEGEPTSMRSVAAYAHYTYAQLAPQELQVTPEKESLKKGGGGNPCVCEQLNSRRTLTLPYPKFVGLKQPSEACYSHCLLSFAFSFAFIFVYLCFAFCILCSSISLCTLSSASSCACQSSLTLPLSLSRLSELPRSQLSDVPTLPTTTTATTNGFHFHCAAHSPPSPPLPPPLPPSSASPPRLLVHATHARHALGRFCFVSFRFVSLRSRLCSLLSGSVLGLRRISRFSVSVRESTVHAAVANQSAPTSQKKTHRDKA